MPKRTKIEPLGTDAFFSTPPAEGVNTDTSITAHRHTSKPVKQPSLKATYYIYPEQDDALEELRLKLRRRGDRVDKSELVRRAIDLLVNQDTSTPVSQ